MGGVFQVKAEESGGDKTWDFTAIGAGEANIQGTAGTYDGLTVDATNGKFYSRGSDLQVNDKTVIKVPLVEGSNKITVVSYPNYHYYTLGGETADADEFSQTYTYSDSLKSVDIVATNTAYLYSIKREVTSASGSKAVGVEISYDGTKIVTIAGSYTSDFSVVSTPASYEFSAEPDATKLSAANPSVPM